MILNDHVEYEETYINDEYNTTTHYFNITKELLNILLPNKYPEASAGTISIEYPTNNQEVNMSYISVSPSKDGSDYDWNDIELSDDEIQYLLNKIKIIER